MRTARALMLAIVFVPGAASRAQENTPSTVVGSPPGFNHPMTIEAVTAAPLNHHVLYEDDHIRLLEVTLWPGVKENMHGHAYPSVFAFNAVQPAMVNDHPPGGGPPKFGTVASPPGVPEYPRCQTLGPQNPHAATVTETYPQHFYRMEYKRLDGDAGFVDHWREWYGPARIRRSARHAVVRSDFPAAWPFAMRFESTRASPDNFPILFADASVRLVEAIIPPGATLPRLGSPFPAVLAFDTPQPGTPGGPVLSVTDADPGGPFAVGRPRQSSDRPATWNFPTCQSVGPVAPHVETNAGTLPVHYYRIEFMRIDGADFARNWRRWYPKMAHGSPGAAAR